MRPGLHTTYLHAWLQECVEMYLTTLALRVEELFSPTMVVVLRELPGTCH